METTKTKIIKELKKLFDEGSKILKRESLIKELNKRDIQNGKQTSQEYVSAESTYQSWYTKALNVVKQTIPERQSEFTELYKIEKRKNNDINLLTYTISDYLLGLSITNNGREIFSSLTAFSSKMQQQLFILKSAIDKIDSILSNIEDTLQSNLFDNELEAAKELNKQGHIRASGVLAGVTLEAHFEKIIKSHLIKTKKKNLTLSESNEVLKDNNLIDIPTWRFIQRLSDLRNLCAHKKEKEPTKDNVTELIEGVDRIIKSVF